MPARRAVRVRRGLTALAWAWSGPASAQLGPFEEEQPFWQPPPTLHETLRGEVRQTNRPAPAGPIDTIRDIFPAIGACWTPPAGLTRLERIEITVRFSLRRDGTVIGAPARHLRDPGRGDPRAPGAHGGDV